ncbi:hypothetical protein Y032_0007g3193 [Ancylostoma ceylanicum]|uniref:Uncharacterized protein n=1 Tax=Ancylostoma ceylanicum TaxID=53326 RepID=A0A016VL84_9BILA|nr:hypothetical protein Y032_0007g3193 [Ancylostoma ceylanicum]
MAHPYFELCNASHASDAQISDWGHGELRLEKQKRTLDADDLDLLLLILNTCIEKPVRWAEVNDKLLHQANCRKFATLPCTRTVNCTD